MPMHKQETSMKKSRLSSVFLIAFILGLGACSKVEYDHKALGFADKAAMESAFAKGYQTKQKLDEMTANTTSAAAAPAAQSAVSEPITTAPATQDTEPSKVESRVGAADNSPFAPSFDCQKASNGAERLVCSDRELAKLDVDLNQIYIKARDLTDDKEKLENEQNEWIKSSRNACSDKNCMTNAFKQRISELSK